MAKGKGFEGAGDDKKIVDLSGEPLSEEDARRRQLGTTRVTRPGRGTMRTPVELLATDTQMKQIQAGQQAFVRLLKTLPRSAGLKPAARISVLNLKEQLSRNTLNELWPLLGEENSTRPWAREGTLESHAITRRIIEEIRRHESGGYALDIPADVRAAIIHYAVNERK